MENILKDAISIKSDTSCLYDNTYGFNCVFNENGDFKGWGVYSNIYLYGSWNKVLFGFSKGVSCYIGRTSSIPPLEAESYYTFKITIKITSPENKYKNPPSKAKIQWLTTTNSSWDENKSYTFDIEDSNNWKTYEVNLGESQYWIGDISNMRIYPFIDGYKDIQFGIRRISIESNDKYKCLNTQCDYYLNYEHPCPGAGVNSSITAGIPMSSYTTTSGIDDDLIVNIDGYGDEKIHLGTNKNITGYEIAKKIMNRLSLIDIGGYAYADVSYTEGNRLKITSGQKNFGNVKYLDFSGELTLFVIAYSVTKDVSYFEDLDLFISNPFSFMYIISGNRSSLLKMLFINEYSTPLMDIKETLEYKEIFSDILGVRASEKLNMVYYKMQDLHAYYGYTCYSYVNSSSPIDMYIVSSMYDIGGGYPDNYIKDVSNDEYLILNPSENMFNTYPRYFEINSSNVTTYLRYAYCRTMVFFNSDEFDFSFDTCESQTYEFYTIDKMTDDYIRSIVPFSGFFEQSLINISGNAADKLGFSELGVDVSSKIGSILPATEYTPKSARMLRAYEIDKLSDGNLEELGYFHNPDQPIVEAGRRDFLESLTSNTVSKSTSPDYYTKLSGLGKVIIDHSHPVNDCGRINNIYIAGKEHKTVLPSLLIFRPFKDGSIIKLYELSFGGEKSDYIYTSGEKTYNIKCNIFVSKGDLIGFKNFDLLCPHSSITRLPNATLYVISESENIDVRFDPGNPYSQGVIGPSYYAYSDRLQDSVVLDIDMGKRYNIGSLDVYGKEHYSLFEFNIASCLDVNWQCDLHGETHWHSAVNDNNGVTYYWEHQNIHYGIDSLSDNKRTVGDGKQGDVFGKDSNGVYTSGEHSYFYVNGDAEWLYAGGDKSEFNYPYYAVKTYDYVNDPISIYLVIPENKSIDIHKSIIYFKESNNFRKMSMSYYLGPNSNGGNAEEFGYSYIENTEYVSLDGIKYYPTDDSEISPSQYVVPNPMPNTKINFSNNDATNFELYLISKNVEWNIFERKFKPVNAHGFMVYCDWHLSTKIVEMELYGSFEVEPSLLDNFTVKSSIYGDYWDSLFFVEDKENSNRIYSKINSSPRFFKVEISPQTNFELYEVSFDLSDKPLKSLSCDRTFLPSKLKSKELSSVDKLYIENTYDIPLNLLVNVPYNFDNKDNILSWVRLSSEETSNLAEIGPGAKISKNYDYPINLYRSQVAINCPSYYLNNLIDGKKSYVYEKEAGWRYLKDLENGVSVDYSNEPETGKMTYKFDGTSVKFWKFQTQRNFSGSNLFTITTKYEGIDVEVDKVYIQAQTGNLGQNRVECDIDYNGVLSDTSLLYDEFSNNVFVDYWNYSFDNGCYFMENDGSFKPTFLASGTHSYISKKLSYEINSFDMYIEFKFDPTFLTVGTENYFDLVDNSGTVLFTAIFRSELTGIHMKFFTIAHNKDVLTDSWGSGITVSDYIYLDEVYGEDYIRSFDGLFRLELTKEANYFKRIKLTSQDGSEVLIDSVSSDRMHFSSRLNKIIIGYKNSGLQNFPLSEYILYTAKSVVFHFLDNHGSTSYMAVRSVDFGIDLSSEEFTSFASSTYSSNYISDNMFITSKSKIGTWYNNGWISQSGVTTNQVVVCNFNTPIQFRHISINNGHSSGGGVTAGVNNTKIFISSEYIDSTDYPIDITQIYDGSIRQHVAENIVDDDQINIFAEDSEDGVETIYNDSNNYPIAIQKINISAKPIISNYESAIIEFNSTTIIDEIVVIADNMPLDYFSLYVSNTGEDDFFMLASNPLIEEASSDVSKTCYASGYAVKSWQGTYGARSYWAQYPYKAIDFNTDFRHMWTCEGFLPHWWVYDFGEGNETCINIIDMTVYGYSLSYSVTDKLKIFGSNDTSYDWENKNKNFLHELSIAHNNTYSVNLNNTESYRYYCIYFDVPDYAGYLPMYSEAENAVKFDRGRMLTGSESLGVYKIDGTFTAKSCVIDIATTFYMSGWRRLNLRSVDFYMDDQKIDLTSFQSYGQTSSAGTGHEADKVFNTSIPKTGTESYRSWSSALDQKTNQRIYVVFNSPITFNRLVINNCHNSGTYTEYGAKDIKIYITDEVVTSNVYNSVVPSGTLLFDGELRQHVPYDVADDQEIYMGHLVHYYNSDHSLFVVTKKAVNNEYGAPMFSFGDIIDFPAGGIKRYTVDNNGFGVNFNDSYVTYEDPTSINDISILEYTSISGTVLIGTSMFCNGIEMTKTSEYGEDYIPGVIDNSYTIGAAKQGDDWLCYEGYIYEILFLPYIPEEETKQKIEGYLAHKWGTTSFLDDAHIYKENNPITEDTIDFNVSFWSPESISKVMWLDASDEYSITIDGGYVEKWADKSGMDNHITQSNASYRPIYVSANHYIDFDGVDNFLSNDSVICESTFSVFVVASSDATHQIDSQSTSGVGGVSGQRYLIYPFHTTGWGLSLGTNGISAYEHAASYMPAISVLSKDLPEYNILNAEVINRQTSFYVNGVHEHTGLTSTKSPVGLKMTLGGSGYGWFDGGVKEIIVVDNLISLDDRQKIEGYLAHKWGLETNLPSGHPYKTTQPLTESSFNHPFIDLWNGEIATLGIDNGEYQISSYVDNYIDIDTVVSSVNPGTLILVFPGQYTPSGLFSKNLMFKGLSGVIDDVEISDPQNATGAQGTTKLFFEDIKFYNNLEWRSNFYISSSSVEVMFNRCLFWAGSNSYAFDVQLHEPEIYFINCQLDCGHNTVARLNFNSTTFTKCYTPSYYAWECSGTAISDDRVTTTTSGYGFEYGEEFIVVPELYTITSGIDWTPLAINSSLWLSSELENVVLNSKNEVSTWLDRSGDFLEPPYIYNNNNATKYGGYTNFSSPLRYVKLYRDIQKHPVKLLSYRGTTATDVYFNGNISDYYSDTSANININLINITTVYAIYIAISGRYSVNTYNSIKNNYGLYYSNNSTNGEDGDWIFSNNFSTILPPDSYPGWCDVFYLPSPVTAKWIRFNTGGSYYRYNCISELQFIFSYYHLSVLPEFSNVMNYFAIDLKKIHNIDFIRNYGLNSNKLLLSSIDLEFSATTTENPDDVVWGSTFERSISLHANTSASSQIYGHESNKAVDGDHETYWGTNYTVPVYWQVDLGGIKAIYKIHAILSLQESDRYDFNIGYSYDGIVWELFDIEKTARIAPPPYPESAHPYSNNFDYTWVYEVDYFSVSGFPIKLLVTFDSRTEVENYWDKIYVMDVNNVNIPGSPFTNVQLAGKTVEVPGNVFKIRLTTDRSVTRWGFKVTKINSNFDYEMSDRHFLSDVLDVSCRYLRLTIFNSNNPGLTGKLVSFDVYGKEQKNFYVDENFFRWIKIPLLCGDGNSRVIDKLGIYPDTSMAYRYDGGFNCDWKSLGNILTDYRETYNLATSGEIVESSENYFNWAPENCLSGDTSLTGFDNCWAFVFDGVNNPYFILDLGDSYFVNKFCITHSYNDVDKDTWQNKDFLIYAGETADFDTIYFLNFDGINDYVNIDSVSSLIHSGSFTLSAWIKCHPQDHKGVVTINTSTGGNRALFMIRTDGMGIYDGSSWYIGNTDVANNVWRYVTLTYNISNNTALLYVDGLLDNSFVTGNKIFVTPNDKVSIGQEYDGSSTSDHFSGGIRNVNIWSKDLTQEEVQNTMYTDFNGDEEGLVAYYKLDEGSGNTTIDVVGGNNGTINGGSWETYIGYEDLDLLFVVSDNNSYYTEHILDEGKLARYIKFEITSVTKPSEPVSVYDTNSGEYTYIDGGFVREFEVWLDNSSDMVNSEDHPVVCVNLQDNFNVSNVEAITTKVIEDENIDWDDSDEFLKYSDYSTSDPNKVDFFGSPTSNPLFVYNDTLLDYTGLLSNMSLSDSIYLPSGYYNFSWNTYGARDEDSIYITFIGNTSVSCYSKNISTGWISQYSNFSISNSGNYSIKVFSSSGDLGTWGVRNLSATKSSYNTRWVSIKRNTATDFSYDNDSSKFGIDYLNKLKVFASGKYKPTEKSWWWSTTGSTLSRDFVNTKEGSSSLRIDYPTSSGVDRVDFIEGDHFGWDQDWSVKDILSFWLYISDIDKLYLEDGGFGFGSFYGGTQETFYDRDGESKSLTPNIAIYTWDFSELNLKTGWNKLDLRFDDNTVTAPLKSGTTGMLDKDLDFRESYFTSFGMVYRGKGESFYMLLDGITVKRNYYNDPVKFGDNGLCLTWKEYADLPIGGLSLREGTVECFLKLYTNTAGMDIFGDVRSRTLFTIVNNNNELISLSIRSSGWFEVGFGGARYDYNKLVIDPYKYDLNRVSFNNNDVLHIALVWSNDGSGTDNKDTIRLYINGELVISSKDTWEVGDAKSAALRLGGGSSILADNNDEEGSAIFSNVKAYNYCKDKFDINKLSPIELERVSSNSLLQISKDGENFYDINSGELPLKFNSVPPGDKVVIYTRIDKSNMELSSKNHGTLDIDWEVIV